MRKMALAAISAFTLFPCAYTQSMPLMSGRAAHTPAPPAVAPRPTIGISGPSRFGGRFGRNGFAPRRFARIPFYGYGVPYFYSDYYEPYEESYQAAPPAPAPAPAAEVNNEPLPDPVLLELHGDQWVRVSDFKTPAGSALPGASAAPGAVQKETPPAVLVYRDGHTEDISSYSIIGDVIYTKAN